MQSTTISRSVDVRRSGFFIGPQFLRLLSIRFPILSSVLDISTRIVFFNLDDPILSSGQKIVKCVLCTTKLQHFVTVKKILVLR